jgi:hypothetical protein
MERANPFPKGTWSYEYREVENAFADLFERTCMTLRLDKLLARVDRKLADPRTSPLEHTLIVCSPLLFVLLLACLGIALR